MAIMTYSELGRRARLTETRMIKAASDHARGKTVFLSHSSQDSRHLPGVIQFLGEFGASTYVDVNDPGLPDKPSIKTAQTLADNIQHCPRLLVLVSDVSRSSRWIPWELGLGHGLKSLRSIATLPIGESGGDESWTDREYLGLYARVWWGATTGNSTDRWLVLDPNTRTCRELRDWLVAEP